MISITWLILQALIVAASAIPSSEESYNSTQLDFTGDDCNVCLIASNEVTSLLVSDTENDADSSIETSKATGDSMKPDMLWNIIKRACKITSELANTNGSSVQVLNSRCNLFMAKRHSVIRKWYLLHQNTLKLSDTLCDGSICPDLAPDVKPR